MENQAYKTRFTAEEIDGALTVAQAIGANNGVPMGTGQGSIVVLGVDDGGILPDSGRIPTSRAVAKAIEANRRVEKLLNFMGKLETMDDLPGNPKKWDTWYVTAASTSVSWDGEQWIDMGDLVVAGPPGDNSAALAAAESANAAAEAANKAAQDANTAAEAANLLAPEVEILKTTVSGIPSARQTATLTAAGWVGDAAPYTQSVEVAGFGEGKHLRLFPAFGVNLDTNLAMKDACGFVSFAVIDGTTLTVTCLEEKPDMDIDIEMEIYV